MDDLLFRLLVVAAVTAGVGAVVAMTRRRPGSTRHIPVTGLAPGVYLFTSAGCDECPVARDRLDRLVGRGEYTELAWETDPSTFELLGVGEAPSTLIVAPDGSGVWHPGVPSRVSTILE